MMKRTMNNSADMYLTALKTINARRRLVVKYSMTGIKEPIIMKLEPSAEKEKRNKVKHGRLSHDTLLRYAALCTYGG